MAHHLCVLLILTLMVAPSVTAQVELESPIAFAIRIYQRTGPSHVDWMGINPPARDLVRLTDAERATCAASRQETMSAEARARLQSAIGAGKLLTPAVDGDMFAYVDRDPAVAAPRPNPWGCTDCFYSVVKVARVADGTVLSSIRLPEFGDHWNYATSIAWSPDGKTLLVGGEAGTSDSKFEDYWLLDWKNKKWRYAGGGNAAKWSPDSSQIIWSAARTLEPLGKIHVWVVHLVVVNVQSLKQMVLTSGTSSVSEFYWCP
jgi:WD40 repeat protein